MSIRPHEGSWRTRVEADARQSPAARRIIDCSGKFTVSQGRGLKLPALFFHEFFEGQAVYAEVLANVRDFGRVGLELLHSDNRAVLNGRSGNHKRVGVLPAFKKLLLLDVLLKVGHGIDSRYKRALCGRGHCK